MAVNLGQVAKQKKIKYFLVSFVDLFGVLRAKLVPARAIAGMQKDGAGFAGFAAWLDMTPAHPDMFGVPDPDSLIQIPWKPEVGWLAADLHMDGVQVEASPRVYDQSALMRRYDVISEICDSMITLGWGAYQNDHEDANGQFEMNWDYDDALLTADRHVFFKYMVKSIAEKHGLRATFMPKPFLDLTGNGCHCHASIWDRTGKKNLFLDGKDEMGLSTLAYHFLGGVLHSAEALCSIFAPAVNSYKRINAPATTSGATWAPNTVTYGGNNRTHMVRIPDPGRFEFRLMDGAANPYLLQAALLATGLDGIANKRDPGPRLDINMYTEGHKAKRAKKLPLNLLDALRLTAKNKVLRETMGGLRETMGGDNIDSYVKLKMDEWQRYSRHLSRWELDHTIDI
jgi:glutamine synthetase